MTEEEPLEPPREPRVWLVALLAVTIVGYILMAVFAPKRHARLENSGMSEKAPYDWTLEDLDGKPVSFETFRGRTVFLNVWATWCGPCRAEMPSIARLAADPAVAKLDVAFVCASTDDDAKIVKGYLDGKDWPMTFLRATRLPAPFLTEGIPATFIIDPSGKIVASEVGGAEWDETRVVAVLQKAAAAAH